MDDTEGIRLLREALARADFTPGGLLRVIGRREQAREGDDALATLIELLYLGAGVNEADARRALAPLTLERAEAMGVLDGGVPLVEVVPTGRVLVVSDPERETRRADRVPGPGKASRTLTAVTPRDRVGRALDMGTGSGVQALLLAEHVDEVVATDVNPRALEFTAFNAALNGLTNVEVREGSLFEPVEGEQFDLVVSNPPYVVSPDTEVLFRDGGLPGDSFSEAVVRQAPALLHEGGFAQLMVSWVIATEEPVIGPPTGWFAGSGCDAIALHTASSAPLEYATSWNSRLRFDPGAYGVALERWVAHYAREGIERIGSGVVVLRRRTAVDNWLLPLAAPEPQHGAAAQLQRLFTAQDYLRANDDEALLEASFRPADDHVVELALRSGAVVAAQASLTGGLALSVPLDEAAAELLGKLGPGRALRDLGGEPEIPAIRRLVELGIAVPDPDACHSGSQVSG